MPTLYLIHNGNAVDGLAGMPNQAQLDAFMATLNKLVQLEQVN